MRENSKLPLALLALGLLASLCTAQNKEALHNQQPVNVASHTNIHEDVRFPPAGSVLDPQAREGTDPGLMNTGPCGAREKGKVHYMSQPLQRNSISWKTIHHSKQGNCTLRLGPGIDETFERDYKLLIPIDGSADDTGRFPCGRISGIVESKVVIFPNVTCDDCTL